MNLIFLLILLIVLTGICAAALALMTLRPILWASWVDKENELWINRGWLSRSLAEKIKKLEQGLALKIFLSAAILINLVLIASLLHSGSPRHFRALLPPQLKSAPQRPAPANHR